MAENEQCEEEWVDDEMEEIENGLQPGFVKWLRPLRFLSKTLDKAITPFVYRSVPFFKSAKAAFHSRGRSRKVCIT